MNSNLQSKRGVVLALLFAVFGVAFLLHRQRPVTNTTLKDVAGNWSEPVGVTGVGVLTIDESNRTVKYKSSSVEFDIVESSLEKGWLVLKLHYDAKGWETTLRIRKLDSAKILCVDGNNDSGQIRKRIPPP